MKKRNTLLSVALLLAVVILGVGYAAASGPWVVEGTATAKASELDVEFVQEGSTGTVESDVKATMEVELDEIGEEATATFVILNNSKAGIAAEINADNITVAYEGGASTSEYFEVTKTLAEPTKLASGDSTTLTVTVRLKKVGLTDVTETFTVSINEINAVEE